LRGIPGYKKATNHAHYMSLDMLLIFCRKVIPNIRVFKSQNQNVRLHSRVTSIRDQTVNFHEHDTVELKIREKME
jgi:hypothetical protein